MSKRWINPPSVYELTMPSSHKITNIRTIVHNIYVELKIISEQ